ncbi:hypothetical protein [Cutibacterium acnes]|nr:hypothetical protein [Cutibacterium acnes]EFS63261.1 hypothetical protein HMPREF9611_01624 [Cutibacterium acnes HL063PA1]
MLPKIAHHDARSPPPSTWNTALTRLFSVLCLYSRRFCRHAYLPCRL